MQDTAYPNGESDITTPDAPTGLTAVAGYASISLNWTAPVSNGGGEIDYYVVYMFDNELPDHPTGLMMNITGLEVGDIYSLRTYIFTVAAHNAAGNGSQSDYADATPYSLPGGIRHLTISSGNEHVNISWLFPESDGGSPIGYYVIYQDGVDVEHTTEGRVTIGNLTNGHEYSFTIAAHNAAGEGPQRGDRSIPMTYPDAPGNLTAIPGDGQVSLSWSAPNDGGSSIWAYIVSMDGEYKNDTSGTSTVIYNLINGQTYSFAVYAHNQVGDGPSSPAVQSTPGTVPGAPTGLKAVPGINNATLSWTSPLRDGGSAIDYYVIYQDGVQLADHVAGTEVVISGLNKSIWYDEEKYTFTVAAHNAAGTGPQSKPVSVIPITIPPAPRRVASTPGDSEITISWMSPDHYAGSPILYYIVFKDGVDVEHTANYSVTFKDLNNGQRYVFSVMSHNDAGNSTHWDLTDYPRTTPDAPTNLTATPGNGQVNLSWSAPTDDGGAKIWSYIIFMDGAMENGTTGTFKVISGLTNGRTYDFTVLAKNLVGEGPMSSGVLATPRPDIPTAPMELTAAPGDGRIELSWSPPENDGGAPIDHYVIYHNGTEVKNVTVNSVTITGLTNGESYSFTVAAHNAAGTSALSDAVQEMPYTLSDAPIGFTAIPGNKQITLNWIAPAFDGGRSIDYYVVYRDRIALPYQLTGPMTIIAGLINGQAYSFTVSAHNLAGTGPQSIAMVSTPGSFPDAPTGLKAVPGKANITLNWTAPGFNGGGIITGYNVYRSITEAGTYSVISTSSGSSYVDVDVVQGQTYWYKVRAVNAAGEGGQIGPVSVILPKAPGAPQDLRANTGSAQTTLTWVAPSNDGGSPIDYYVVYQDNIDIMHVTGNSSTITGLTNGQSYSFTVAAHNSGGFGAYSDAVQTTPFTFPDAPVGLTATPGNGFVTLNWTTGNDGGSPIMHYDVTQNGAAVSIRPTGLTYVITGLTNGRSYNFSVAGHNSAGIGPYSYAAASPMQTEPSVPMNVTASTIDSGIALAWAASANNGGYPITYMVFRGTAAGSESPLVNIPDITYSDKEVVLGIGYYYFVKAINQLGSSAPSNEVGPVSASAAVVLEMETDTSSSIGISITITGEVRTVRYDAPIAGVNVDLSYSVNDGLNWIDMASVLTSATGSFSTQWIPSATGVYSLRGSWAGNTVYQAAISVISLAVDASSDNHAFTVQSNSTISDLSFNSQKNELSFKVSGDPGTFGYSRIVISKELVPVGSDIKVSLDGTDMEYQLTSTDSSWILYFTYHHSTHSIVASLNEGDNGGSVTDESPLLLIAIAGTAIAAILLVAGLVVARKRKSK